MTGSRNFKPLPGACLFRALHGSGTIIMACNTRATIGICAGIFRAAKELDAAVIMELAKSESDLKGGYTGLTPKMYAGHTKKFAEEVGFDVWALHADHTTVKKGTDDEISSTKELISAQASAGFTSFAMDCSFLFDEKGRTVAERLARNIEVTTGLVNHLKAKLRDFPFGLEVEVGEIGKKGRHGRVLTTPEEAVHFIRALNKNQIFPHGLAIANGSAHGNAYNAEGNPVPQLSIDIPRTIKVGKALENAGLGARLVQHGITGTPLGIIAEKFPKKYIIKGNVGTLWQNILWDVFREREKELYRDIRQWTLETFGSEAEEKGLKGEAVFGTYSKSAYREFFARIYGISGETEKEIERRAYLAAKEHFIAFGAKGSASKVRNLMETEPVQKHSERHGGDGK